MFQTNPKLPSQIDDSLFFASTFLFVIIIIALIILGFVRIVPWEILVSISKGTIIILLAEIAGDRIRQKFIGRHKGFALNLIGGMVILIFAAVLAMIAYFWGASMDGEFNDPFWNALQNTIFLLAGIVGIDWIRRFRHFRFGKDVPKKPN
jgi:MFS family permease